MNNHKAYGRSVFSRTSFIFCRTLTSNILAINIDYDFAIHEETCSVVI